MSSVGLACEHLFVVESSTQFRICYRCGQRKPEEEFAWKRKAKGQRDSFCRACRSAYGKEHYLANKKRYVDQAAASKRKIRLARTRYLIDFFRSHPCVDCGETDPIVLDFDHVGEKLFGIGQMLERRSWQSILEEMAKCQVVCANCHRRRTAQRRGTVRAVLSRARTN